MPELLFDFTKRDFSVKRRAHDAKTGAAMPGGGYPIENRSDLHNAIQALGRAKNRAKTIAHIKARARALGATGMLPDTFGKGWGSDVESGLAGAEAGAVSGGLQGGIGEAGLGALSGGLQGGIAGDPGRAAAGTLTGAAVGAGMRKPKKPKTFGIGKDWGSAGYGAKRGTVEGGLAGAGVGAISGGLRGGIRGAIGGAAIGAIGGAAEGAGTGAAVGAGMRKPKKPKTFGIGKDWSSFDAGRAKGPAEKIGGAAALGGAIYHAPGIARAVKRAALAAGSPRLRAAALAGLGTYAAVRGAQHVGGYIGRRIDSALGTVSKDGLPVEELAEDIEGEGPIVQRAQGMSTSKGIQGAGPQIQGRGPDVVP